MLDAMSNDSWSFTWAFWIVWSAFYSIDTVVAIFLAVAWAGSKTGNEYLLWGMAEYRAPDEAFNCVSQANQSIQHKIRYCSFLGVERRILGMLFLGCPKLQTIDMCTNSMFMPALTWTRYKSFNVRLFLKVFVTNEQTVEKVKYFFSTKNAHSVPWKPDIRT